MLTLAINKTRSIMKEIFIQTQLLRVVLNVIECEVSVTALTL